MNQITELSEEQLKILAKEINNLARRDREEERRKRVDNSYHNTRELLIHYHMLKKHCEIVNEQLNEELGSLWSDWRFDLNTLLEHKAKTAKLMNHVDRALIAYKSICDSEKSRGYDILNKKYLMKPQKTDQFIADFYDLDRTTINKSIKKSIGELSILLYGIDVVKMS